VYEPDLAPSPRSMTRREMLWEVGLLASGPGKRQHRRPPLTSSLSPVTSARQMGLPLPVEQDLAELPGMSAWEQVAAEYEILGLSPDHQAMALLRKGLDPELVTSAQAALFPDETEVRLAGLVVCRQRPSTAKGVLFISLEDEYGIANLVVWSHLFERQRMLILTQPFLIVRGVVQHQGSVVHIIAREFERPNVRTDRLIAVSHDFH
jgi:error-prone DNA polymerase